MLKKVLLTSVTLLLMFPSIISAGSFGKDDPSGTPGNWYVGTTPSYVASSKHTILFVHGLNSSSSTWWEENDMYNTAYQAGFETAFIDLYPTNNMWDNGSLLAQKVKDIYSYFGEKVVVVAHSKGGVDTQSALVHYGAAPYVERVITLSSPHHGSQLADLAYSSWAGWLANIIGSKSDATYSLQTGYMEYFRSETDGKSNVLQVPIYTFGGTEIGSFGSSLYWGGLYLNSYGANDGAVTVASSRLPYATELQIGAWDHSSIKEGTSTFSLFESYLGEKNYAMSSPKIAKVQQTSVEPTENGIASIVRGGETAGMKKESFNIEKGVDEITIDWMSNQEISDLTLIGPTNKKYTNFKKNVDETEYFNGAYHHTLTIPNPASGTWTLETEIKQKYLLHVTVDSPLNDSLKLSLTNDTIKMKTKDKSLKIKADATIEYYKNGKLKQGKVKVKDSTLKVPNLGEGVYNITIDIEGKQGKSKFERTKIKTVYVDKNGKVYK
ncbi:hypothetical protein KO561_07385 [Radiobacillus kanasensis]|uniref:esterase/lipase family protein n=1 Tax=Radiobacillus kanasensis TaxID=2844358 RepID=UPI001E499C46|nr:hypothetical protein [Radiobacillus kanasensis]UFU00749.1 hypothetical protein KO561_07385 [Radiobacillus kanasensis]